MSERRAAPAPTIRYELRFTGLSARRCDYAFPCDKTGLVDIDQLADRRRTDYFYARTMVGKELSVPVVVPVQIERRDNGISAQDLSVFWHHDRRETAS